MTVQAGDGNRGGSIEACANEHNTHIVKPILTQQLPHLPK